MAEKLTYEFVKSFISNDDYILLTTKEEYENTRTKLKIQCNNNHIFEMDFSHFQRGHRCSYCSKKRKYTYQEVKKCIESENGYKLLSKNYRNCKEKLEIQCNKGHVFYMSFDTFKNQGCRCPICNIGGNFKYTIKIAQKIFVDSNCILLSKKYTNCDELLDYICECGNTSKISLTRFLNGDRCYLCRGKKIGDALRLPFTEVDKIFKDGDCELLSNEIDYKNAYSLLRYKCSCGNISSISLTKFQQGHRCLECLDTRRKKTNIKRFNVEHPMHNSEIKEKVRNSLYQNGTMPCPTQQKYLHLLLGGKSNYPVKSLNLDIAFPNEKLYIEFDGSGHDLQVKHDIISQEQFEENEKRRSYTLYHQGWKEIRIISKSDKLPQDNIILQMIGFAKSYLSTNHSWITFDIDNSIVKSSQFEQHYDFGKLRRIRKSDLELVNASSF